MTDYRQATRKELDLAVQWATQEGWNPGKHDADAFWATDPQGFVCAERDGEVIATGSIVSYGREFGFMGFFIVRPELRGQGIGREFWTWRRDLLRSRLSASAAIGMDGVFDMLLCQGWLRLFSPQPAHGRNWARWRIGHGLDAASRGADRHAARL